MSKDRSDSGRYVETVTLADVLAIFEEVEGPVVTSGDVADALECSRETARRKLGQLEDRSRVKSRQTAGRVVWWLVDDDSVNEVDPGDPIFSRTTYSSGESTDASEHVDDILYGNRSK
ncbi:HTH domain-containing protein [Haladaptatus sp. AB643]|uniref:HTH domain-containing protein n=1 Tax=Haladaptatus sp. AB643 TaxID=2934174 RepID=UPI00209C28AD|nr:HTH domain-containing protein [Haladaptatus sp. AB643]MCO8245423.1 HTH domain-containing protein [Haladaptatus sp. AB643]